MKWQQIPKTFFGYILRIIKRIYSGPLALDCRDCFQDPLLLWLPKSEDVQDLKVHRYRGLIVYTLFCLSTHLCIDIWITSVFCLFWIMLLWNWVCINITEELSKSPVPKPHSTPIKPESLIICFGFSPKVEISAMRPHFTPT